MRIKRTKMENEKREGIFFEFISSFNLKVDEIIKNIFLEQHDEEY